MQPSNIYINNNNNNQIDKNNNSGNTASAFSFEQEENVVVVLRQMNFNEKTIKKLIVTYGIVAIQNQLRNLTLNKKGVQNYTGWLLTALREDYQIGKIPDVAGIKTVKLDGQDISMSQLRMQLVDQENEMALKDTGRLSDSPFFREYQAGKRKKV